NRRDGAADPWAVKTVQSTSNFKHVSIRDYSSFSFPSVPFRCARLLETQLRLFATPASVPAVPAQPPARAAQVRYRLTPLRVSDTPACSPERSRRYLSVQSRPPLESLVESTRSARGWPPAFSPGSGGLPGPLEPEFPCRHPWRVSFSAHSCRRPVRRRESLCDRYEWKT